MSFLKVLWFAVSSTCFFWATACPSSADTSGRRWHCGCHPLHVQRQSNQPTPKQSGQTWWDAVQTLDPGLVPIYPLTSQSSTQSNTRTCSAVGYEFCLHGSLSHESTFHTWTKGTFFPSWMSNRLHNLVFGRDGFRATLLFHGEKGVISSWKHFGYERLLCNQTTSEDRLWLEEWG